VCIVLICILVRIVFDHCKQLFTIVVDLVKIKREWNSTYFLKIPPEKKSLSSNCLV